MFLKIAGRIFYPLINLFIKSVEGIEHIPRKGPFIIAINHSHFIDVPILEKIFVLAIKRKIHFVTSHWMMNNWLGNKILGEWLGFFPYYPTAYYHKKALPTAITKLHQGEIVAIFPEGDINRGKLLKAHTGVARMALEGYAVLPIGIRGVHKIGPTKFSFPRIRKEAEVFIGKPLFFKKVVEKKITKRLLEKNTRKIMKSIARLSGNTYSY